jgi:hypothetical protein
MNAYYQSWVEIVARIDRLQLQLFLIVLTGYWLYRGYVNRQQFVWVGAGFSLVVVAALAEPLFR